MMDILLDVRGESVVVTLENGRTLEGALLVGADGVNSAVRRQLFPTALPRACGYNYW